jgi:hypothetical protein
VVKEEESENRIHSSCETGVVEEAERGVLGVEKGSCSAQGQSSGNDVQQPLLAMESTLKCDILANYCLSTTAEEVMEMVGVQDNCLSRRKPMGKDAYQPAFLRKSTPTRDISKMLKLERRAEPIRVT